MKARLCQLRPFVEWSIARKSHALSRERQLRLLCMETPAKERVAQAAEILDHFAARTGLTAVVEPRRYLWTDAFAVMTWIGLHEETRQAKYPELASRLVVQVHETLGVSRNAEHPTSRGVRICTPLAARAADGLARAACCMPPYAARAWRPEDAVSCSRYSSRCSLMPRAAPRRAPRASAERRRVAEHFGNWASHSGSTR